jgi:hypothetical protein
MDFKIRTEFKPPNANAFDIATSTLASLGTLLIKFIFSSGSSLITLIVGTTTLWFSA